MEDGKITLVEDDLVNAAYRVTRRLVKKFGGSLITVFYGEKPTKTRQMSFRRGFRSVSPMLR